MSEQNFSPEKIPDGARNYLVLPRKQISFAQADWSTDPNFESLVIPMEELMKPGIWNGEIKTWEELGVKPFFDGFMGFSPTEMPFKFKVALYIEQQVASYAAGTFNLGKAYTLLQSKGYTPEFNLTFYHASLNHHFIPDPLLIDRYKFYPMLYNLFTDLVNLAAYWRTGLILYIDNDIDPTQDFTKFSVDMFPPSNQFQIRELLNHNKHGIYVGYRMDS